MKYFESLLVPEDNCLDPILLLIIQALRTGAVEATSIADLITATLQRQDKTIQWLHEKRPVLPQFNNCVGLDVSKSARYGQLKDTMTLMAQGAGVLQDLWAHDIRRGGAAQVARNPAIRPRNLAATAEVLGHSDQSIRKGITSSYAGANQETNWALRVQDDAIDAFGIRVAQTPSPAARRQFTSPKEIDAVLIQEGALQRYKRPREEAGRLLKKRRNTEWQAEQKDAHAVEPEVIASEDFTRASTRMLHYSYSLVPLLTACRDIA